MFIVGIALRYFILRKEQGKKHPQSEILLKFSCNHGDQWTVVTLMAVVACTHRDFRVFVRFEASILMLLRMQVFWYVKPCCCGSVFRRGWGFWGSNNHYWRYQNPRRRRRHFLSKRRLNTDPVTQSHSSSLKTLKDEGTIFFRNVGKLNRWQPHSSNLKTLRDEGTTFFRNVGKH